jgi:Tfp pilus assembly protein PilF
VIKEGDFSRMKRPLKKKKEVKRNEVRRNKTERSSFSNGSIERLVERKTLVAIFLFFICFGVFTPSLRNGFVWDDIYYIKDSPNYFKASNVDYRTLFQIKEHKGFSYYRPTLFISFVIDHELWDLSPFGFHLSNVIFYSISTVLFYLLVLFVLGEFRVDGKEVKAFLSSLFFAFYPTHVESASWVSGRMDLLCSLFFFPAFVFHILSYRKLSFLALTGVCFSLSLLSKEVAVAFPIVVLCFDILSRRYKSRDNILRYAVYGVLILIYLYLRGRAIIPESPHITHKILQMWEGLRVLLCSYLFYIKKLLFPFDLNPFITTVPQSFYYLISSIIVILLLCIISFISIRRKEYVTAFSIFWIFITLGPSSFIVIFPVAATPLANRYLYIPSAGYCLLIGYLIIELGKRVEYRKVSYAFGFALCLSYLFFTIGGQGIWKDDLTFWRDISRRSPDQFIPHIDYGAALRDKGKTDDAIQEFLTAFNSTSDSDKEARAMTATNLGIAYIDKGDYKNAEEWLLKALDYDPTYENANFQMGFIYFVKWDLKNAEEWFLKALNYDSRDERVYYHLGATYLLRAERENYTSGYGMAEKYLTKALEISDSQGDTHLVLAKVYVGLGEREKAREHAKKALQMGVTEPLAKQAQDILNMN